MALFGDLVKGALGGFPEKPRVPDAPKLTDAQQTAIESNINNLPGIESLASRYNQFNLGEIDKALNFAIPGFDALTGRSENLIQSLLRGEIPQDVNDRVQTSDAVRALTGGYGGTGMHGNLVARDLGLTSLDLTQRGLSSAEQWIRGMASLYEPGLFNVGSMFITPMQKYGSDVNAWNVKWLGNQLKALPDPQTAAIASDVGAITDSVASALSTYLGGIGGIGIGGTVAGAAGSALSLGSGGGVGGGMNTSGAGLWSSSNPYANSGGGGGL